MADRTVKCPECGVELPLVPLEGDANKLVAYHNCRGDGTSREVVRVFPDEVKRAEPVKPAKSKGE